MSMSITFGFSPILQEWLIKHFLVVKTVCFALKAVFRKAENGCFDGHGWT